MLSSLLAPGSKILSMFQSDHNLDKLNNLVKVVFQVYGKLCFESSMLSIL